MTAADETQNVEPASVSSEGRLSPDAEATYEPQVIEIGWLVFEPMDAADLEAVEGARKQTRSFLSERFGQFHWKMTTVRREQRPSETRVEPAALLDDGVAERDLRRWDFTVIVTPIDLISYYRKDAVAAVSRSLEGIVISTSRLDPRVSQPDASDSQRVAAMTRRLTALVLHGLGHHTGLAHSEEAGNLMAPLETLDQIDQAEAFNASQQETMAQELAGVADRRLEETPVRSRSAPFAFYLKSAWLNRREIITAVREARPWEMPYRLSGLTTAAVSTMLVLIMSAEAWDLAIDQTAALVVVFSLLSICATTTFLLLRQRLLLRGRTLSEQTVTTNVATVAIVLVGIVTSYAAIFLLGLSCGLLFFRPSILEAWTEGSTHGGWASYLKPAGFGAALAMLIGALGATFDRNHYFRHITAVDEEV
ncbi:MAG: hypothetical protein DWQ37_02950 [Planctomycetota bacterium]|nr:MAG: hypothetical protein DWQ37_02950 [Planctomycetota bacterium]